MPPTTIDTAVRATVMPYRLDDGAGHRVAIGLVVLATDQSIEHEWRQLLDLDGVAFFANRINSAATVNPDNLKAMEAELAGAAGMILPGVELNVIAYGCTAASLLIGEKTVAAHLRQGRPNAAVTTPITAARAALTALDVKTIALLTPYIDEINHTLRHDFETRGFPVPVMGSFNNERDAEVARISLDSVCAAVLELGREPSVEGVFVSCTNLRLAAIVEALEAELGKPVTSSCHAMAWHGLRLAGYRDEVPGRGRLFRV
jgi:maleate isomerase